MKALKYIQWKGQSISELEEHMRYERDFKIIPSKPYDSLYIFNNHSTNKVEIFDYILFENNDVFVCDKFTFEEVIKPKIAELEALQNRSCESCNHYRCDDYDSKEEILNQWVCCNMVYVETRDLNILKDFCCNKWESK
mgnify:CR=1 FL=1